MTSLVIVDSRKLLARHQLALLEYARRVILHGDMLSHHEEIDKSYRMMEFMAIGNSFKLTAREMVYLIYRELFTAKRGCGCGSCTPAESG